MFEGELCAHQLLFSLFQLLHKFNFLNTSDLKSICSNLKSETPLSLSLSLQLLS